MDEPRTESRGNDSDCLVEYAAAVGAALLALLWVTSTNTMDLSWGEVVRYAQMGWQEIFPPG